MKTIPVIVNQSNSDEKSIFADQTEKVLKHIESDVLNRSFNSLLSKAQEIFSIVEPEPGEITIKEITLNLDISASGEVRLIGGVGVEVAGGMQIKLERKS